MAEPPAGGRPPVTSIVATHLRVTALHELQYRANFFLAIVQSMIQAATAVAAVAVVYSRTDELNGWSRDELLVAVGTFMIVTGVLRALVEPALQLLTEEVDTGAFDFILVRPVDAQLLMTIRRFDVWQLTDVVVGLVLVVVAVVGVDADLSAASVAMFVLALAAGCVVAYQLWLLLTCAVFWIVRMPWIGNIFYYVSSSARYPISIYPPWMRFALSFVVPLGLAITVPAEALTGRLGVGDVVTAFAVAVGLSAVTRLVWNRGVRRYSGASA